MKKPKLGHENIVFLKVTTSRNVSFNNDIIYNFPMRLFQ